MARVQHKKVPINMRVLSTQKALIDRAAALSNKSRSEFILDSACREAESVLLDQRLFFLDEKRYAAFLSKLISPVELNLKLKMLIESNSPWEKKK